MDGGDLAFYRLGVFGPALYLGPALVLDKFDELKLEADHVVLESRVCHGRVYAQGRCLRTLPRPMVGGLHTLHKEVGG
jgi:hypothetical protein